MEHFQRVCKGDDKNSENEEEYNIIINSWSMDGMFMDKYILLNIGNFS